MTTYVLVIFLAYSSAEGGPVALQNERIDFFSLDERQTARRTVLDTLAKDGGFRRAVAACLKRSSYLLDAPQKP